MNADKILGIDGGGTSTTALLADSQGRILGRGTAGPSNAKAVGVEAARRALDGAIVAAFQDAGIDRSPAPVACFGLAGFDRPEDHALLRGWSSAELWAERLVLVNDGELVLAAGTPEGIGVGVISGTGSIAVGKGRDGRMSRAGGGAICSATRAALSRRPGGPADGRPSR
ncbi:MAG: BadF/BadG/BcrA/BcrD ATPase family protein [Isosphaeraceae bacterium]